MALPLISRIFSLSLQFERDTNFPPKALYVGQKESDELDKSFVVDGGIRTVVHGIERRELNGIPVYKVDAESYLACG